MPDEYSTVILKDKRHLDNQTREAETNGVVARQPPQILTSNPQPDEKYVHLENFKIKTVRKTGRKKKFIKQVKEKQE